MWHKEEMIPLCVLLPVCGQKSRSGPTESMSHCVTAVSAGFVPERGQRSAARVRLHTFPLQSDRARHQQRSCSCFKAFVAAGFAG